MARARYYADEQTLDELEANQQIIYRYSDEDGKIVEAGNPNGSLRNIAGICNKTRNVFGMMPHPERACSAALGNTDGIAILRTLFIDVRQRSASRQTASRPLKSLLVLFGVSS